MTSTRTATGGGDPAGKAMAIDRALGSSGGSSSVVADPEVASTCTLAPAGTGTTWVVSCNVVMPSAPIDEVCSTAPSSTASPSTVITSTPPATTGTVSIRTASLDAAVTTHLPPSSRRSTAPWASPRR